MTIVDSDAARQRSTVQLVKDLTQQATTLVHQEIELVKVELNENLELAKAELAGKGKKAGAGVAVLAAAGVAGLLALGTFTAFVVLALDGVMPNWAAALCASEPASPSPIITCQPWWLSFMLYIPIYSCCCPATIPR